MRTWGFSFLSLVIQRKAKSVGTIRKRDRSRGGEQEKQRERV